MQDTLVLNKHWRPVAFTTWGNAVKLWYEGAAKIIRDDASGNVIRSQHLTIPIPRVIVVNNVWKRKKKLSIPCSRRNLYIRDNGKCQYCGVMVTAGHFDLEHVIPECQGGGKTWTNAVVACKACNSRKGGLTPEQAGMKLLRVPKPPDPTDPRYTHKLQVTKMRSEWQDWASFIYQRGSDEQTTT